MVYKRPDEGVKKSTFDPNASGGRGEGCTSRYIQILNIRLNSKEGSDQTDAPKEADGGVKMSSFNPRAGSEVERSTFHPRGLTADYSALVWWNKKREDYYKSRGVSHGLHSISGVPMQDNTSDLKWINEAIEKRDKTSQLENKIKNTPPSLIAKSSDYVKLVYQKLLKYLT